MTDSNPITNNNNKGHKNSDKKIKDSNFSQAAMGLHKPHIDEQSQKKYEREKLAKTLQIIHNNNMNLHGNNLNKNFSYENNILTMKIDLTKHVQQQKELKK